MWVVNEEVLYALLCICVKQPGRVPIPETETALGMPASVRKPVHATIVVVSI